MADPRSTGGLSRAQQFEDEKRRIMQSCFAKQDTDGSLLESYITHCRIIEDSASPSEPPSNPTPKGSEKNRLIFVAVRKSGRVRMHKARENNNGTFSIGKTWNLDDLQAIQVHRPPNEKGFTVVIVKPYYWQAGSSKEKDFFISSLIKIYRKYTGGKIPELIGFKEHELEALLGKDAQALMEQNRRDREAAGITSHVPGSQSTHGSGSIPPGPMRSVSTSSGSAAARNQEQAPKIQAYQPPSRPSLEQPQRQSPQITQRPSMETVQRVPSRPSMEAVQRVPSRPSLDAVPRLSETSSRPSTSTSDRPSPIDRRPSQNSIKSTGQPSRFADGGRSLSNSRSGQELRPGSRGSSNSRSPMPDSDVEREPRREPSLRERLRAPSASSQTGSLSDYSRADDERPPPLPSSIPLSPVPMTRQRSQEPTTQNERLKIVPGSRSRGELAAQFRNAANAFSASAAFSGRGRPTTPGTPSSPPKGGLSVIPPGAETKKEGVNGQEETKKTLAARPPPLKPVDTSTPTALRAGPTTPRVPNAGDSTPLSLRPGTASSRKDEPTTPTALRVGLDPSRRPSVESPQLTRPPISREASAPEPKAIPVVNEPTAPPLEKVKSAPGPYSSQKASSGDTSARRPGQPSQPVVIEPSPEKPKIKTERSQSGGRSESAAKKKEAIKEKKKSVYLEKINKTGLSVDLEDLLDEFKWNGQKSLDKLQAEVKAELNRVESSNVVVNLDRDDRVDDLAGMLERAIKECEYMDGLLTLYSVELASRNDDILHIEGSSHGLQVQTANQKLLQKELSDLLETISISPEHLAILRQSSFDHPRSLVDIEATLVLLFKAIRTIDAPEPPPMLTPSTPSISKASLLGASDGIGSMRALQDKREDYQQSCEMFLDRLHQFLNAKFGSETIEQLKRSKSQLEKTSLSLAHGSRPQIPPHDELYTSFWRFVGLMAFVRDMNESQYLELQKLYEKPTKQLFLEEVRDHVLAWKKITKTPSPDDIEDWVFTTLEKEPEHIHSAVTAARKLTVKKSIARIRGDSISFKERPSSLTGHGHHHSLSGSGSVFIGNPNGIVQPHVAFETAFNEITTSALKEQNFLTEFFMISSRSTMEFLELVTNSTPESRRLGDLGGIKAAEPDKDRQKEIRRVMGEVFSFLPTELGGLVDWVVTLDPTQSVGVLCVVEQKVRRLEETDQEWIRGVLEEIMKAVEQKWEGWVEDQTRAIEETKVKVKKRKGVVGFIRVFPTFAEHVESQLPATAATSTPTTRATIDKSYTTLNTSIFSALHSIALLAPTVTTSSTSNTPSLPQTPTTPGTPSLSAADPEDKASLNYHITMLENHHHYTTALTSSPLLSSLPPLTPFLSQSRQDLAQHLAAYTNAILHRPVGKLLDFVTSVEAVLMDPSISDPSSILTRPQFTRHQFKKVLKEHDGKEVRKGIEALKKRVEKHFLEDEYAGAGGAQAREREDGEAIVGIVLERCESEMVELHRRVLRLVRDGRESPYRDLGLECEFRVEDVRQGFRR